MEEYQNMYTARHSRILRYGRRLLPLLVILGLVAGPARAIRPGDGQSTTQQSTPTVGDVFPSVPGQAQDQSAQDGASRKLVEQPRQQQPMNMQRQYADTFLANSVRYVTDPQDGLTKDGRVALMEGFNAQVVYQFYGKIFNAPNEPDLTIYTHDKGGFDGPYNVFVANFGDSTWMQLGMDVTGTAMFDLPPTMPSADLVLIINRHAGATYIEAVEAVVYGASPGMGAGTGMGAGANPMAQAGFNYYPEELIGLRAERLDFSELERARMLLSSARQAYQLAPLGEIEVKWMSPINNVWKTEEFYIEAEGEYEVYASDSRGMEIFIGRRSGTQGIDLPQDMTNAASVRIRNSNNNRPVILYAIGGRR